MPTTNNVLINDISVYLRWFQQATASSASKPRPRLNRFLSTAKFESLPDVERRLFPETLGKLIVRDLREDLNGTRVFHRIPFLQCTISYDVDVPEALLQWVNHMGFNDEEDGHIYTCFMKNMLFVYDDEVPM
jgi:hypothetical protein